MDRYGDLKAQIAIQINLTKNEDLIKLLKIIKDRLDTCGHCNGPTYEDGLCVEHFV